MKAMSFYTANGWAGSNYDSKLSTLDNCPVGFFQTKEEAEREAETLNGFTDGNGRLKTVI